MYLLDTNVVSDAHKGVLGPLNWLRSIDPFSTFLSVITIGEIERGIAKKRLDSPAKAAKLAAWLDDLRGDQAHRILAVTEEVAVVWGQTMLPKSISDADGLIAATAIAHKLTVATRNVGHFAPTGARLVNPWTA